jgi:hypothetical protein
MSQCLKVPVHVLHGSKCHGGRFDLGRIVKAPKIHSASESDITGEGHRTELGVGIFNFRLKRDKSGNMSGI